MTEMPDYSIFSDYANKLTQLVLRQATSTFLSQQANKATSVHLLDENTATFHFSLMLPRPNSANKLFFQIVDQLLSGGLIQKLEADRNFVPLSHKQLEEESPQQLTMNHLGICFAVIMICLALCCIVFLVECLTNPVQIWWSNR
jgi:hypothetical protein